MMTFVLIVLCCQVFGYAIAVTCSVCNRAELAENWFGGTALIGFAALAIGCGATAFHNSLEASQKQKPPVEAKLNE